jgi:hypothetical protein
MSEEKKVATAILNEVDDADEIDNEFLRKVANSDEESLTEAMSGNPFKLFFTRFFIHAKNHITVIPFLFSIGAMVVITFSIPSFLLSIEKLHNDTLNPILFFANMLLSVFVVLSYMKSSERHISKKKKYLMLAAFYLFLGLEVFLDFYYLHDMQVEMSLFNTVYNKVVDNEEGSLAATHGLTILHLVLLGISALLAALEPLLQPLIKRIHIK